MVFRHCKIVLMVTMGLFNRKQKVLDQFMVKFNRLLRQMLVSSLWLYSLAVSAASSVGASSELMLEGKFTQGGMIIGKAPAGSVVMLDDKTLRLTPEGQFVFGFGRDAKAQHQLKIVYPDGAEENRELEISARDYDIQYIEGISQKIMSPDPDDLKRIQHENGLVYQARNQESDLQSFGESFIWPAQGPISGVYGSQRFYNGEPRRPHFGLDIAAPKGADVIAPASGRVVLVHKDMFFSGGTLIVDHGYGITSTFIHLSAILVEEGQKVAQGDLIAKVGASGRATGPHLDWRINWFQTRLDPALLLKEPAP